ncbi:MAG: carboxypeptidase-like regulatory domain-containing protein [Paludibacteraceae bacterium]
MKNKISLIIFFLFTSLAVFAQAQKVRVYGYVIDENNRGIENAGIRFEGTNIATSTNQNGYYDLSIEVTDSVSIVYSHIGYETIKHTIYPNKRIVQITVILLSKAKQLKDVNITSIRRQTSIMESLDAGKLRQMPNTSGNFESLLISFSGVTMNNELSSQYNVRGGSFDENIVYVNGTEIYKPLLIRAGQQEGLSFINTDMVGSVNFAAGGFNAEYGDKMSSVLDIKYKKPESFEASAMVSLLGASAYVGTSGKRFTQMHGIRYKTSQYLLGTLDTKGEYKPSFIDYQTYLTYQLAPKWEVTFLGNFSQNNFNFVPESRETTFGTYSMGRKLMVYFDGQEKDLFQTSFGALTLNFKPNNQLKLGLQASAFNTNENETYDIHGEYILSEVKMDLNEENKEGEQLGVGVYHQHARNRLKANVATLAHNGEYAKAGHTLKWGANFQIETISDKINEWEWRDSAGYSMPYKYDNVVDLYYNLKSNNPTLTNWRTTSYIQDTYRWDTNGALYTLTGGIRTNFWSFNNEFILSPRVSFTILPHWRKDFGFRVATGVYYQSPFYKEMRDTITDALGNLTIQLNKNIKAQRSLHFVLGGDYYFRGWGRPFKLTTEAYLKLADRIISYSVDNVRIRYTGENDAKAYTTGIDMKLFGELVPGTDSWINVSLMQSKQNTYNDWYLSKSTNKIIYPGWISRPNEQRYSFSMLFSDYLPNNPKYKLHLRAIYSDGLPMSLAQSKFYMPVFRSSSYKRVDIGASREIISGKDKLLEKSWMKHIKNIWLNFEIFNLFDFKNVNSYYWVTDVNNVQNGVPNYLTSRQFNLKITVDFK